VQRPVQPAPVSDAVLRAAVIEALIPAPPPDIAPLRIAFCSMVSRQWEANVPTAPANPLGTVTHAPSAKARFIAEMYARACYSMLLVSANGPKPLRLPVQATAMLPLSRGWAIRLGSALLASLDWLVPQALHRQLLLTSTLMGTLDVVLDQTAYLGEAAVLRIASLISREAPAPLLPIEQPIASLAQTIRRYESAWQSGFWETVLQPAVRNYCLAEALAVAQASDPAGMGHRWAGIDAAIKGMWYVVGPRMGLQGSLSRFEHHEWNREQQWMADTSLLLQMIDDWVDQDEDRGTRVTPVVAGDWSPKSVTDLYHKTVQDLSAMLGENGVQNRALRQLFVDLYNDYLHVALGGMSSGVAS
jgi:hypothetical protein